MPEVAHLGNERGNVDHSTFARQLVKARHSVTGGSPVVDVQDSVTTISQESVRSYEMGRRHAVRSAVRSHNQRARCGLRATVGEEQNCFDVILYFYYFPSEFASKLVISVAYAGGGAPGKREGGG